VALIVASAASAAFLLLTFLAWRRYLWVAEHAGGKRADPRVDSLSDVFGEHHLRNVPHQKGVLWLSDIFSRSAKRFPHLTALQIPHTGDQLTFAELDARAERIAAALAGFVNGPDQIVAVAMTQDNWQIVASHLAILKAGGTALFLDTTLPEALVRHMLEDARPVVVLTRGQDRFRDRFRDLPTLDVLTLPQTSARAEPPTWLDDPAERLATIFYTSGTTGMPKGVECPHAGYVNLSLSYADYFDLVPGMDATTLTSSLGYDGSISEMYSAWVSGCAVVLLTKEQVRSGPDLVPVLRQAEVTVLFCPPVLLATLTANPEVDLPYPICRYVVPAGEAFPNALVEPWTRARRQIINTYGPTEASTDTSRQSLRPGEPITIGSPFPNVTYVILEIDQLHPLPHGEAGELCIGGMHVARGYRNLPEETARKFIIHPRFGRLYRTGDRCRIDIHAQRVDFLGRIDAQIKVRGHRVEAQAVEDILQAQFSEIEAAVVDYQNETLVAFVAAPSICGHGIAGVRPAPAKWADRVMTMLHEQLPAHAVPTRLFLVEKFVMKPVSGKIDRSCLPDLSHTLIQGETETGRAGTESPDLAPDATDAGMPPDADAGRDRVCENPACEEVLAICRAVFGTPLRLDDGFVESGGHSLLIARLAQQLQAAGWVVPVRALLSDCNTARKVASRPRALKQAAPLVTVSAKAESGSTGQEAAAELLSVGYFTTLQVVFATLLYSPALIGLLLPLSVADVGTFFTTAGLGEFILAGLLLYVLALAAPFASLVWVMAIKLFLSGSIYKSGVRPGVYPKWSRAHLRVWCIGRLESMALLTLSAMYRSAPLLAFVLRQLGARVGKNLQCAHDASLSGPLDLLSIGDDVAIQTAAYVQTSSWSDGQLHVGPVTLESGCKIGMRAGVANDVTVGRGSWITPFTPILTSIGSGEMWEGAPARLAGGRTELNRTAEICRYRLPIWLLETLNLLMQIVIFCCLTVVPTAAIAWLATGLIPAADAELSSEYFRMTAFSDIAWRLALYAFITTGCTSVVTSLLGCVFVRCTAASPGLYPSRGLRAALLMQRMRMMNRIQLQWTWTITGQYLRALAGMRFPRWGASECDVMFNLVPELATADSQVFWSNGCFTNMLDCGAAHFLLRQLEMPRNFFSGNNCVAEYGNFPSNFLLGVSTPASEIRFRRQMRARLGEPIVVAGNPPLKFAPPTHSQLSCPVNAGHPVTDVRGIEESSAISKWRWLLDRPLARTMTADAYAGSTRCSSSLPGFSLFLARVVCFDLCGISILPVAEGLIFTLLYIGLLRSGGHPLVNAVIAFALTEISLVLLSAASKRILVGSRWGSDDATAFWSWRHFAYFLTQDCFFVWCRGSLGFCAGTILSNSILRLMGCRIGRRTIVTRPLQCSDWKAVSFGDDCVIDGFLQFHTFEDMVLKVKRTDIQDGCTLSFGATVMGGAVIERSTTLLPLSLVLKEMRLPGGSYEGSPAEPVSATRAPAEMHAVTRAMSPSAPVDNTDWLKAAAIVLVSVDHFGHFFMDNDLWWAAFGRLAAPVFFFLAGYAQTRTVPPHWILLGLLLTLLNSWNADWTWVAPNILLSLAFIRVVRPHVEIALERYGWSAFALLVCILVVLLVPAANVVDYGAEGWLWALFGLCQRRHIGTSGLSSMRLLACLVAVIVYIWHEQKEFSFPLLQLAGFIFGLIVLSLSLCLFRRGASRIQPPRSIAGALRFIGRHTLEIYAIQLAGSELIVKLVPDLGS
jgi:amino acid adenylation domain-containing protein